MTNRGCRSCGGTGYMAEEREGRLFARPCSCRRLHRAERVRQEAAIPERYQQRCVLGNYVPAHPSQEEALLVCRRYVEEYPLQGEVQNGLLIMGTCGVGKTHLAVGILQEVLTAKKMPALFVDLNDLYREIRGTYGKPGEEETEYDILSPLVEAPLLLIDELGCVATPWAQDTLHYLVSQRYNEQRPTLLTSNYLDAPPRDEPRLEDRIGTRTRSRLHEMCRTLLVEGPDHRRR